MNRRLLDIFLRQSIAVPAGRDMFVIIALLMVLATTPSVGATDGPGDLDTALSLATMLQAARAVIGSSQAVINDPSLGDKGLTGDIVLERTVEKYIEMRDGREPVLDEQTREGRLIRAQMDAIRDVVDANQSSINQPGIAFKGFVPAVFARLTNERFAQMIGQEAEIKVTAPVGLVRNRKARPDEWEANVIETKLLAEDWPHGRVFQAQAINRGRDAFRVLVPEYYSTACLACHGEPKGEIDITGYPKEGGKEGNLGGVISITLYE